MELFELPRWDESRVDAAAKRGHPRVQVDDEVDIDVVSHERSEIRCRPVNISLGGFAFIAPEPIADLESSLALRLRLSSAGDWLGIESVLVYVIGDNMHELSEHDWLHGLRFCSLSNSVLHELSQYIDARTR